MNKNIDYEVVVANIHQSLNALEYDSMRSAGKTKFNATTLNELYAIKDALEEKLPKKALKSISTKK